MSSPEDTAEISAQFSRIVAGPGQTPREQPAADPGAAYYAAAPAPAPAGQFAEPLVVRYHGSAPKSRIDILSMFPVSFSLMLMLIFAAPLMLLHQEGQDIHTRHWLGSYTDLIYTIPIMIVVVHLVHVAKRGPMKYVICFSIVAPCLLILIVGDQVMLRSLDFANRFAASDCDTFPLKRLMERDHEEARTFHADCVAAIVAASPDSNMNVSIAAATTLIQDCPGYAEAAGAYGESWYYLKATEEEQRCGGWCTAGPALWTALSVQDSCTAAVSEVLYNKIQRNSQQAVFYTLAVLAGSSVALIVLGPVIRSHGIDW